MFAHIISQASVDGPAQGHATNRSTLLSSWDYATRARIDLSQQRPISSRN